MGHCAVTKPGATTEDVDTSVGSNDVELLLASDNEVAEEIDENELVDLSVSNTWTNDNAATDNNPINNNAAIDDASEGEEGCSNEGEANGIPSSVTTTTQTQTIALTQQSTMNACFNQRQTPSCPKLKLIRQEQQQRQRHVKKIC